ncbi:MAG: thioredoxin domain-containing protein [Gammaproteobacteria bacterium]|nr:thioredoxin domain-containing protein [Gammaproteobacteria bacterium]
MKKLIILVLMIAAAYAYKPDLFSFSLVTGKGAFDEQGNPETLVFVHDKCGAPCADTVKFLNKRRIDYSVYPLDNNDANQALWKQYGAVNSFPNVIVGDERVYGSYKSKIVSALALNYGDKILTSSEKNYMKKHFNDDGSNRLVLYGASWCPHCKKMRAALKENNIDFLDIDVEKSATRKSMTSTLEINGYPLMYYGYKRMDGPRPKDVLALF